MNKSIEIDLYISTFPKEVKEKLDEIREIIQKAAPDAKEGISYSMPAFKQKKVLVYFAGYKNHIGFYPTATVIQAFKDELSAYKWSKGAVQFPIERPLPANLISKMVKFKVNEDISKQ